VASVPALAKHGGDRRSEEQTRLLSEVIASVPVLGPNGRDRKSGKDQADDVSLMSRHGNGTAYLAARHTRQTNQPPAPPPESPADRL
jgi:hypothetical protein